MSGSKPTTAAFAAALHLFKVLLLVETTFEPQCSVCGRGFTSRPCLSLLPTTDFFYFILDSLGTAALDELIFLKSPSIHLI